METRQEQSINLQLIMLMAARFVLNTGLRFVYPFAPELARGLNVPRQDIYYLITLRNLTGFLSPLFGPLSERYGRRSVLVLGMLIFSAGALMVVLWPYYWILGAALCATGIAKILYDPAMQAYVGEEVPYQRRGRAIAITEYSWSLALIVGVPIVGLIMQQQGWRSPFLWLGIGGIIAAVLLWRTIHSRVEQNKASAKKAAVMNVLRQNPVVIYAALYMILFVAANEMLFIVFGGWMEDSFGLSLTSLGVATAIIGGAELTGETISGWSVDRYGKRPVIIFFGAVTVLCNMLLPVTSTTLAGALATLFVLFLSFEITIVGGIPLMTELVPQARAVVMSIILAAMFAGRTLGSFLGPIVWNSFGFSAAGIIWAAVAGVAILILYRKVKVDA
ncbi:MAG: MFS transporter [Candidatus Promineifilaceae bacterium]